MQLEELERQWQRLDQKLDRALAMQSEIARRVVLQPARRRVNRLAVRPVLDVVFSATVLIFGAAFLGDHWRDGRLLIPAAVVTAAAAALLTDSVYQLRQVVELDWAGPVAAIQGSLERLRVAKIRQFKWVMLLAPLVGFCGLVVGVYRLLEWLSDGSVDILDKIDSRWVAANYLFGVVFVPVGYLAARTLSGWCQGHPWWQSVLDGISGKSLKAATLDVKRWASLQAEPSDRDG